MSASATGVNLDGRCSRARQHAPRTESGRAWAACLRPRVDRRGCRCRLGRRRRRRRISPARTDVADAVWAAAIAALLLVLLADVARKLARGRIGVDAVALARHGRRARARPVPRRGGDRAHAQRRQRARGERRAPRAAGARHAPASGHRRSPTSTAPAASRRFRSRRSRVGRHRRGAKRRDRSRRRYCRLARGGPRRVDADGRAAPGPVSRAAARCAAAPRTPAAPFELRAGRPASESAYAALVRLVRAAENERAPFVRLADRYAAVLLPVTLAARGRGLGGAAATPCARSRCWWSRPRARSSSPRRSRSWAGSRARRGAGSSSRAPPPLEQLGRARTDRARQDRDAHERHTRGGGDPGGRRACDADTVLALAAAVDQLSPHVLAEALVGAAARREPAVWRCRRPSRKARARASPVWPRAGTSSSAPRPGCASAASTRPRRARSGRPNPDARACARVLVGIDGRLAGVIVMADHMRRRRGRRGARPARSSAVGTSRSSAATTGRPPKRSARRPASTRCIADRAPDEKVIAVRALRDRPGGRPRS